MATDGATSALQDGHRRCYISTSGWPQTVLHQHQDGHRRCYIKTSGWPQTVLANTSVWPQTVLHQDFRMATECARSTLQDGHQLLHQDFRMATECARSTLQDGHKLLDQDFRTTTGGATVSLIPSDVGNVSTVLPSTDKMQFCFTFHDLLRQSVSKLRLRGPCTLTSQLKKRVTVLKS
jgi:hypothetical protein